MFWLLKTKQMKNLQYTITSTQKGYDLAEIQTPSYFYEKSVFIFNVVLALLYFHYL